MSEQNAEPSSVEPVSLSAGAGSPSSDSPSEAVAASTPVKIDADAPSLVPGQGDAFEASQQGSAEAPRETAKAAAPRIPSNVMIMSSADRAWDGNAAGPDVESGSNASVFGRRRRAALAAVVALATAAGALGGALATAGLTHFAGGSAANTDNSALGASIARIDADILALKADVEHTARLGVTQYNKIGDRLDKVEKAQAEPAAKLAKLSEAIDKLRAAPPVAPVAAAAPPAAKEVTGSVSPPAAAPVAAPKIEVGRLPTVEGWVLRDVANGGALIEGRQGIYEVYAGDPVPGLGRIDAIRRQDGRWVVVTSRGLIVGR